MKKLLPIFIGFILSIWITVVCGWSSESSIKTVPSSGPSTRTAIFKNVCSSDPIYLSIRYYDANNKWVTRGWKKIHYGKTVSYESAKDYVYYFAEGGSREWGGEYKIKVSTDGYYYERDSELRNGRYEGFRKKYIRKPVDLSCN